MAMNLEAAPGAASPPAEGIAAANAAATQFMQQYRIGDTVPPPYFVGIYDQSVLDEPQDEPFDTPGWIDHCRAYAHRLGISSSVSLFDARRAVGAQAAAKALYYFRFPRRLASNLYLNGSCPRHLRPCIPIIRDIFLRKGSVRVLDIGGGFGDNFFELGLALPHEILPKLEYDVVDNARSCELGQELYKRFGSIKPGFIADHTNIRGEYDLAIVVGTLQFMPSWRDFLASLAEHCSNYSYFARSPISERSGSYFTRQLICPAFGNSAGRLLGTAPVSVIGRQELLKTMHGLGWQLRSEFLDSDYSPQFARIPQPWSAVNYYNLAWQRREMDPLVALGLG
jgi:putative methyltransferase (TIGR04325 family)